MPVCAAVMLPGDMTHGTSNTPSRLLQTPSFSVNRPRFHRFPPHPEGLTARTGLATAPGKSCDSCCAVGESPGTGMWGLCLWFPWAAAAPANGRLSQRVEDGPRCRPGMPGCAAPSQHPVRAPWRGDHRDAAGTKARPGALGTARMSPRCSGTHSQCSPAPIRTNSLLPSFRPAATMLNLGSGPTPSTEQGILIRGKEFRFLITEHPRLQTERPWVPLRWVLG